jgi:predicted Rossmann-fold nucleotide-binding protein
LDKPLIVAHQPTRDLFDAYHRMGLILDRPHLLYYAASDNQDAVTYFDRYFEKNYSRVDAPPAPRIITGQERPEDLYSVTFYGSASYKGETLRKSCNDFGYLMAQQGMAFLNGGGTQGLMVETSWGFQRFRKEERASGKGQSTRNWIGSIQCMETQRIEGLCDFNDFCVVEPNIFLRMDRLQDTNAEVFFAGGAGTLQEFFATVMMRLRGLTSYNRPLILVNETILGAKGQIFGVFDPLLKILPEEVLSMVQVVKSAEEAVQLCVKDRAQFGLMRHITQAANNSVPTGKALKNALG